MSKKRFATIKHADERITRRVSLYVRRIREDGKTTYAIFSGAGEDCGPRFATREQAMADASNMWRGPWWDLQYEDRG